jgi:organic radical activating enzyme
MDRNWRPGGIYVSGRTINQSTEYSMEGLDQVRDLINKDLSTEEEGLMITGGHPELDYLHEKLTLVIEHLLRNNFEKLCHAMYRLDVSERKYQEVLTATDPSGISARLADLVIEREMQKVVTRKIYRKKV